MRKIYLLAAFVAAIFTTGCKNHLPNSAPEKDQAARAALSAYVTDFWSNRDTLAISKAFHPALLYNYNGDTATVNYKSHRDALYFFGKVFPDLSATIDVFTFDGKYGAAVTTWTGTHNGTLYGVPANNMREVLPTGRKFSWQVQYVFRVQDGRIIELWETWDEGGLYTKIMRTSTQPKKQQ